MAEPLDKDIIPINWGVSPYPHEITLSICPMDEIGMPFDKRGLRVSVPDDPAEWQAFAKAIATQVQKTIIVILESGKND